MANSKMAAAMAATAGELQTIAEAHRTNTERYGRIQQATKQMAEVEPLLADPLMDLHRQIGKVAKLSADIHRACESAAAQFLRVSKMASELYNDDQANGASP